MLADVRSIAPASAPVFAFVPYPRDLEFHLGRPVETLRTTAQLSQVCRQRTTAVLVGQPWLLPPVTVECTSRRGARHLRFEQYARGEEVNVWLIPPAR